MDYRTETIKCRIKDIKTFSCQPEVLKRASKRCQRSKLLGWKTPLYLALHLTGCEWCASLAVMATRYCDASAAYSRSPTSLLIMRVIWFWRFQHFSYECYKNDPQVCQKCAALNYFDLVWPHRLLHKHENGFGWKPFVRRKKSLHQCWQIMLENKVKHLC